MADNTTRPNTSGGDVIRSEEETSQKTQVFKLDPRILPVSGSAALLEQLRDAKMSRLELLRALPRLEERGAAGMPGPGPIPDTRTILDILGTRLYRWYQGYEVGTWTCALGSGDATQGTTANKPSKSTFPISGRTYPTFDGSATPNDDFLSIPTLSTLPTYTSSDFFLMGGAFNVTSNPDSAGWLFETSSTDDCAQFNSNQLGIDGVFNSAATVINVGWVRWLAFSRDSTHTDLWINGAADIVNQAAALGNLWKSNTFKVGSNGTGGNRIVGSVATMFWARSSVAYSTGDLLALDAALKRFVQ